MLSIEDVRAENDEFGCSPVSGVDIAGLNGWIRPDHRLKLPVLTECM